MGDRQRLGFYICSRNKVLVLSLISVVIVSLFCAVAYVSAQDNPQQIPDQSQMDVTPTEIKEKPESPITENLSASQNVSLDFKDADISNVLKIISYKGGINIVSTPDVIGNVTIKLTDVPWEQALDVILKTYGFGYQKQGNIILVTKIENMAKIQSEEALKTEIITLKFLDAQDAARILMNSLSSRGKISIVYARGQKGWKFGTFKIGGAESSAQQFEREKDVTSETVSAVITPLGGGTVEKKFEYTPFIKSKTLLITDTASSLDNIRNVILPQIDRKPKQVLIETKIVEVNMDKLKDIGFDWAIGDKQGAESSATPTTTRFTGEKGGKTITQLGGHSLVSQVSPSIFTPKSSGVSGIQAYEPYNAGIEMLFQKVTGMQLEAILHALEEDVNTNTLSAPRIMTLDNQEASILVGYHTPILKSEISGGSSTEPTKITQTLSYYQEIGIRLNVLPQVNEDGYINMIIHPSVTSSSEVKYATSMIGTDTVTSEYPVIDVREAQTQILIKDGETVVIGGLLKDVKSKSTVGVPFLSKIPLLGLLFQRETHDTAKIDLLVFISAHVVKDDEFSPGEIAKLEQRLDWSQSKKETVSKNKKEEK